jgi:hypothetical protein
VGSRGHRVRSPMGVALQGMPALFSIHGVLGFGSSIRGERGETVLVIYIYIYIYIYILFLLILFVGIPKNGLQQQMSSLYNSRGKKILV